MGVDGKYGRITTERLEIPDDEPVFLFRGRDKFLPDLLRDYVVRCQEGGSPAYHLEVVMARIAQIEQWQAEHLDKVRTPDSARLRELLDADNREQDPRRRELTHLRDMEIEES